MSAALSPTRPAWYSDVPAARQGLWSAGDHWSHLAGQTGYRDRVRIVLKDGSILDGFSDEERNRWDRRKHAVSLRITGRKTRKWVAVSDIAVVWADKGESLESLLTRAILATH